jgi:hypothetical protein
MWWEYVAGVLVKYTPTVEEQVMVGLDILNRKRQAMKGNLN